MADVQQVRNGQQNYQFRKFDISNMCPNPSIAMIAKRGSGKSWTCRDILRTLSKRGIPGGMIIAPTDEMNTFYGDFFPDTYIHYKYKSEIIEKLLHRQTQMIEKQKQKQKEGKKLDPRVILLMDDCLSSKGSWSRDELISRLFFDGRHYQITYILTMQFPLGIQPELRQNFDYVFLFADDVGSSQKKLYEHYAGMFDSLDFFKHTLELMTKDFGCMVICNRGAREKLTDKIFWYRASDTPIGKIGCKEFNEFHQRKYDKDWKKKTKPLNLVELFKKKKNDKVVSVKLIPE